MTGSRFAWCSPVAAAVIALASLLVFVWSFDPATSPIWQVALHHLMLALFMFTTFVLAAQPRSFLGEGFRRAMLVSAIGLPVVVFSASWVMNGAYEGVRDERFFSMVMVSATSFMLPMGGFCPRPGGLCVRQVFGPGAAAGYPRGVNPPSHAGVRDRLGVDLPPEVPHLPWSWRLQGQQSREAMLMSLAGFRGVAP